MTRALDIPSVAPAGAAAATRRTETRALLACGVVAGPLFIVVGVLQMLTRDGFDPSRHPLSLLSLGDLGWIQIANFVIAGLLFIASGVGMRWVMYPGRGGTWGPRLIGVYGAGLLMGGVFVADAALGFPPGTPEGTPDQLSWHGILHSAAPVLASLSLLVACFVFARRFAGLGQRGWAAYCVATGVASLVPDAFLGHDWFYVVLGVAVALGLVWVSAMAARLLTELPDAGRAPRSATIT
ncbi:MAG TPA: DUF998 domain-containing protein [Jiangellaceae bacterium]|nr:DUF998 domain-containing protein [Jiangellaceae bacterium]